MGYIDISSDQLAQIGRYDVRQKYLMYMFKGFHIRLDQKTIGKQGARSIALTDKNGVPTGSWGYRVSSFHVKREKVSSFISATEGPYLGKKINTEDTNYVYFTCAGGGVWQPIWGYGKFEEKQAGKVIWQPDKTEIDSDTWSFACTKARWFLAEMSKATGSNQDIAAGPIQGSGAHLFNQL